MTHLRQDDLLGNMTEDSMVADRDTRLELCWARASCPQGPLTVTSPTENTRVDMRPGYPVILYRLFAPSPHELPPYMADDVTTYLRRATIDVIWNSSLSKPKYDVWNGASWYGVSQQGGSFKLNDWYLSSSNFCNCYDLAGITQLACSLLIDGNQDELVNSHWVFQLPNGYINCGPLIRWVTAGGLNLKCNSPFWGSAGLIS
jgi:hypothetical protein